MATIVNSRIRIKQSTVPSQVPTIPASNDHTDGSWLITDIYEGEFFWNIPDKKLYQRSGSSIVQIMDENSIASILGGYYTKSETDGLLDGKLSKSIVVSSNHTAVLDEVYHNVASATYTDPSPVEGKGFTVFVRNGTATVGGAAYATVGTIIIRTYHSGSWSNYVYTIDSVGTVTPVNTAITNNISINEFASRTQGQIDAIKTYQDETYDYLERIKLAGGRISDYDLSVIDEVVCRGKSDGWFTKLKSFWIPVGDFEASKIFLTTPTGVTPVFYNFVSTDYNINTGYALSTNTNKYIDTFFIPNNNGVTANNITIGMTSLRPYGTSGDGFGFIVGADNTGAVRGYPFIDESTGALGSDTNNRGGRTNPSYGSSLMLTSNGTKTSTFFNGVLATEHNENLTAAQTNKITIFRNYRENTNTYYSNGGVGAFFIGTALTNTEVLSLQFTLEFINAKIRNLKNSNCLVVFGDSVSAGQAAGAFAAVYNVNRYSTLLSQRLGLREFNVSQPSRKVNGVSANAVDGITSYPNLLKANKTHCIVALSVNDASQDPSLATTGTLATYNAVQSSLTTMLTNLKTYKYLTVCMGTYNLTTAGATCMANYTLACANAAVASGSLFIDPYRLFVDTGSPATYMADTVHPNIAGHSLIAKTAEMIIRTNKLYRRPLIAGTTVNAGTSYTVDVTVLCSQLGAGVQVQLEDIPDGLMLQNAYVQATNNIRIVIFNPTGGNIVLPNTYANIFVDKTY